LVGATELEFEDWLICSYSSGFAVFPECAFQGSIYCDELVNPVEAHKHHWLRMMLKELPILMYFIIGLGLFNLNGQVVAIIQRESRVIS